MNITALYVEDDPVARENGIEYLESYFEKVYEASDGVEGLKLYQQYKPDIIITDIQMPKLNGLDFVKRIRQKDKTTKIIVISAFSDSSYLLQAIELGLIKYLIKPVKEEDFHEAIEICIESIKEDSSNIISLKEGFYYDTYNHTLVRDETIIKLRTKEIALMDLLIKHKNRFVTYQEIENFIWTDSVMTKDALKTLIKNLKSKLPKDSISNLTGTGYKIEL
ncbi:MAG: response regulator [Campylobacterales bacterium]|nr:response regulator [Campylobacterales bacterium]